MATRKATTSKPIKRVVKKTEDIDTAPLSSNFPFKLQKIHIIIGLVILLVIFLYVFKSWFVVALVNGQPVTRLEFTKELEKQAGKQTLNTMVTKALILQEAKKQNVTVSQPEVDAEIKKIENNLSKQGKTLNDALSAQGLTRNDLVEQITMQKTIEKLLGKEIKVSDQEVNDYIAKNSSQFPEGSNTPELKDSIKQQLQQQKLSEKFQSWLANLQKNAKITYFIKY